MASEQPMDQLFDLCTGEGATASKIKLQAPFMESLPATQHALEVLPISVSKLGWSEAARALLICATRPNGAAGLDEHFSRFAVACLALDGSAYSMTQRLNNLVHGGSGKYPTSRNTLIKMRALVMKNLASKLQTLEKYPCASDSGLRSVARQVAAHIRVIMEHQLPTLEDHEKLELYRQIFEELPKATSFFRGLTGIHTLTERFEIIVRVIASGAYRSLFEDIFPRGVDLLVSPDLVPSLYAGSQTFYDPMSPEVNLTVRIMYWVMRDTEKHGLWYDSLVVPQSPEAATRLAMQQQRLRRYFDALSYSY